MKHLPPTLLVSITLLASVRSSLGADAPITPEARDFFEQKIRPVLVAECYECHNEKKHKGGLRLDYRGGWQKGGESGETIIPGDPKKSLFMQSIRHEDPDLKMPDKSPKLDDSVIADFDKWVGMGAPDPRDQPPVEQASKPTWAELLAVRRTWWALQPVKAPAVPAVKNPAWSENPIDRFLLAKMEEKNLAPAAEADPRTVIRRLSFALIGLPPTPQEVEVFVADAAKDSAGAVRAATDRLLASPRFGEHWARHWMDLMRYAETHGSEGDPPIPEVWRYRDYLIRAFNSDVPLDQLIREHLAGDLLPKPRLSPDGINESILGTAQFRLVEHGFQPVDTLDDQIKAVDNQIDVVSKAFQGLTVSCARCHDHKFDAISQRDWTALYGIFSSCRPAQVTIDTPEVLQKNRAELERLHAQIRASLADAWQATAQTFSEHLLEAPRREAQALAQIEQAHALEQKIADLDWSAQRTLDRGQTEERPAVAVPAPYAAWRFELDGRDSLGHLPGHLEGGAEIKNGRLVLNGLDAYFRTDPLPVALGAKTLEAWVAPANLDQRAGGVVTVESTKVHGFDSIVFAEKEPRRWLAGSNFFARTQATGGPMESVSTGQLVHLAVTYAADGTISFYRNGESYGTSYSKGDLLGFNAGQAQVLLGLRHTGAKNGFFAGEIEEARLYDRALTSAEVAASFHAGSRPVFSTEQVLAALTPEQRIERQRLSDELAKLHTVQTQSQDGSEAWTAALKQAETDAASPLYFWAKLSKTPAAEFPAAWQKLATGLRTRQTEAKKYNQENFRSVWDLTGTDYAKWFPYGSGLGLQPVRAGEFNVEPEGDRVLEGLVPAGAFTARLSDKQNGILTSPRFKIDSDSISVRAFGGGGSAVRVIVDNYPLPSNPIFPKAPLDNTESSWRRLDTAYRKGTNAYVEFATFDDLTRPLAEKNKEKRASTGRSFFGVAQIVFHNGNEVPQEEASALTPLLGSPDSTNPQSLDELATRYQHTIEQAVAAWREDRLTEPQRELLDHLARSGLLPTMLSSLENLRPQVEEYRKLEAELRIPQRAPGVLETVAYDAPFLPRGDYLKPEATVPRGYLEVIDPKPYQTTLSGRLELAADVANAHNPLTARVMVNRVWHWLYGRGLVPTVDNFGRLGEKPTHPELLDFLAARLVDEGWSVKAMVRDLVTTRAFQMSSAPSATATEVDPANEWLSHMRVRRIEAESIRDSILAVSGDLQDTMYGPSANNESGRRSVYLGVRRTFLNPFLQVFDAPKPFTTLGRRDATNVPAQSLTMLNSVFVSRQGQRWALTLVREKNDTIETRIERMFNEAFARPPSAQETSAAAAYLATVAQDRGVPMDKILTNEIIWQDLAQSLFNLKEFIYVR